LCPASWARRASAVLCPFRTLLAAVIRQGAWVQAHAPHCAQRAGRGERAAPACLPCTRTPWCCGLLQFCGSALPQRRCTASGGRPRAPNPTPRAQGEDAVHDAIRARQVALGAPAAVAAALAAHCRGAYEFEPGGGSPDRGLDAGGAGEEVRPPVSQARAASKGSGVSAVPTRAASARRPARKFICCSGGCVRRGVRAASAAYGALLAAAACVCAHALRCKAR